MSRVDVEVAGERVPISLVRAFDGTFDLIVGATSVRVRPGNDGLTINGLAVPYRMVRSGSVLHVEIDGEVHVVEFAETMRRRSLTSGAGRELRAEMPGRVASVRVQVGDRVALGTELMVLESMKLHVSLAAVAPAVVREILVAAGDTIDKGELVMRLEPDEANDAST